MRKFLLFLCLLGAMNVLAAGGVDFPPDFNAKYSTLRITDPNEYSALGLHLETLKEESSFWNFKQNLGRFVGERLPANTAVWANGDGEFLYKADCGNRIQEMPPVKKLGSITPAVETTTIGATNTTPPAIPPAPGYSVICMDCCGRCPAGSLNNTASSTASAAISGINSPWWGLFFLLLAAMALAGLLWFLFQGGRKRRQPPQQIFPNANTPPNTPSPTPVSRITFRPKPGEQGVVHKDGIFRIRGFNTFWVTMDGDNPEVHLDQQ